jgi:hypothetical protein
MLLIGAPQLYIEHWDGTEKKELEINRNGKKLWAERRTSILFVH